ncbi:PREDICTED: protein RCC2 [Aptenodytes forsteri]|uniref:protein RCC2 n=1 Tax=Aptenodytes forsteri TaxID=9233 RepID=UPI000905645A|nr:PREDICTED: protein RCC2 [Aptenodytes forsteri]
MGQLGLGNQTDAVPSPTQIMYNGQPITKLACGAEFSMIMDCKGNLYSFGCPEYGQLGHNSDGKFIARAQRIEYDCELVPRRVAIFIEKTKDGQILPVPNVVVRDVACGANHTERWRIRICSMHLRLKVCRVRVRINVCRVRWRIEVRSMPFKDKVLQRAC